LEGMMRLRWRAPRTRTAPRAPAPGRPVRVGGNIKQPRKTKSAAPVYPRVLQEAGLEGVVKLDVLIDTEGHVSSVRVLNSLVHPAFADAAATAVKQWEFT